MESVLWVYTRRTDMLHASPDRSVQEKYWECVERGGPLAVVAACILDYFFNYTFVPVDVRPEDVYIVPVAAIEEDGETGARIIWMRFDRCSLVEAAAIASQDKSNGLDYGAAQSILSRHRVSIAPFTGLSGAVQLVRYTALRSILGAGVEGRVRGLLPGSAVGEVYAPVTALEERCRPVL